MPINSESMSKGPKQGPGVILSCVASATNARLLVFGHVLLDP